MSLEEFGGWIGESASEIDQGTEWQESSESKEKAIARIEKEQKKAAQTRGQIQDSKKDNKALAAFMTFLLQNINNEKIIMISHDVFFHKTEAGSTYVNHKVFAWTLAPFFWQEAIAAGVEELYNEMYTPKATQWLQWYISYLKKLSYTYHDNIALDQQALLQLIIEILKHFHIIDTEEYSDEKKKEFIIDIVHDLFGIQHTIDVKKVIL
jgi:hypothetical protein